MDLKSNLPPAAIKLFAKEAEAAEKKAEEAKAARQQQAATSVLAALQQFSAVAPETLAPLTSELNASRWIMAMSPPEETPDTVCVGGSALSTRSTSGANDAMIAMCGVPVRCTQKVCNHCNQGHSIRAQTHKCILHTVVAQAVHRHHEIAALATEVRRPLVLRLVVQLERSRALLLDDAAQQVLHRGIDWQLCWLLRSCSYTSLLLGTSLQLPQPQLGEPRHLQ